MAHNVTHELKGTKLLITVDLSAAALKAAPQSKSGKTRLVGSTGGSVKVDGVKNADVSYSINIMDKAAA